MTDYVPTHKIYDSTNTSLIYNIEDVVAREPALSIEVPNFVEHANLRSGGSITVPGGNEPYNMVIRARLGAANYTALMTALQSLQSTILINTHYYLRIGLSVSTSDNIKIQRLSPISVVPNLGNLRTYLYYDLTLRCLSW